MQPGLLNPKFVSPGWPTEASAAEGSCYAMFAAEAARIPAAARRVRQRLLCIFPVTDRGKVCEVGANHAEHLSSCGV